MSVKETPLTRGMQKYVNLQVKALDRWFDEVVEPMLDIGSPATVIDKPYPRWTEADFQAVAPIFGSGLDRYILSQELKGVKEQANG